MDHFGKDVFPADRGKPRLVGKAHFPQELLFQLMEPDHRTEGSDQVEPFRFQSRAEGAEAFLALIFWVAKDVPAAVSAKALRGKLLNVRF